MSAPAFFAWLVGFGAFLALAFAACAGWIGGAA